MECLTATLMKMNPAVVSCFTNSVFQEEILSRNDGVRQMKSRSLEYPHNHIINNSMFVSFVAKQTMWFLLSISVKTPFEVILTSVNLIFSSI